MSSLSKAAESTFNTYIENVKGVTLDISGTTIDESGDLDIAGALELDEEVQALFFRPPDQMNLLANPTYYRALSNVLMQTRTDEIATAVFPNNMDFYALDNNGANLPLSNFGSNFKLDLVINGSPTATNNFIEIQLIDNTGTVIAANEYYSHIITNANNGAIVQVDAAQSWQLQVSRDNPNETCASLNFNLDAMFANGTAAMYGQGTSFRQNNNSFNTMNWSGCAKGLGLINMHGIRLRINNGSHGGYQIRSRLYSVC